MQPLTPAQIDQLPAILAASEHLHGLHSVGLLRYAGVHYGLHLAAFADDSNVYAVAFDRRLRLQFVQCDRNLEVLWSYWDSE